ncbi:MAG TPA: serine/threonine-protein kinase, partial [Polyangiaceae bacterium]|nr:serine/threonine-protein kinase [Polyangiaceae bacterium]
MAAAADLTPGARISNRYRVERLLGRGGMAAVYEVLEETSGTRYALKRLESKEPASQAQSLFQREYSALAQLAHPRIVRVYDYALDGAVPYYLMELLSGASVRSLAPLPWREACSVLRDVASALAIVHSRRLIHRDVTPRNIHRTADGHAKLMDFGSLCTIGVAPDIIGTPPFLA